MRTLFRSLVAATMLTIAGINAATAAEPLLGTWNLNMAKSQFGARPGPQSATRVFTMAGDALDMLITGAGPGTASTSTAVFEKQ